jgi:hypothetical protein
VIGDNTTACITVQQNADSGGNPALRFKRTRGTTASPTIVQPGDIIGAMGWHSIATDDSAVGAGYIECTCTQAPVAGETALRTRMSFAVGNGSNQGVVLTVTPTVSNFINSLTVGGTAVVLTTDSRLSDARAPTSHAHGNISNSGAVGSTANLPLITTTSGVITTSTFGTAANTFCQGNDSRLSDARSPTAHASQHASGGSDPITPSAIGAAPSASPTFTGVVSVPAGTASAPGVTPTGDSNTGLWAPSADTLAISTGGVERLRVTSDGKVGIGTTPVSNATALHVNSTASSTAGMDIGLYSVLNCAATSGNTLKLGIHSVVVATASQATSHQFFGITSQFLGQSAATLSPYQAFRATCSMLSGGGTLSAYTGFAASTAIVDSGTVTTQYGFLVGSDFTTAGTNIAYYGNIGAASGCWNIYMAGTAQNYLAGNLGIGSGRTVPTSALDVDGVITVTAGSVSAPAMCFSGDTNTGIYTPAADTLSLATGGVERLRVDASGDVGIGATSTGARLYVSADGGHGVSSVNTGGDGTNNFAFLAQATGVAASNTGLYVNAANAATNIGVRVVAPAAASSNWAIYSDATAKSFFAGNVGIGTSNPDYRLKINTAAQGLDGLSIYSSATSRSLDLRPDSSAGASNALIQGGDSAIVFSAGASNTGALVVAPWASSPCGLRMDATGNIGIGTASPTVPVDIAGSTMRLRTARTPASATATGSVGEVCWDATYMYVCTATNTWRRIAHATW